MNDYGVSDDMLETALIVMMEQRDTDSRSFLNFSRAMRRVDPVFPLDTLHYIFSDYMGWDGRPATKSFP